MINVEGTIRHLRTPAIAVVAVAATVALATGCGSGAKSSTSSVKYPTKQITIIVPSAAGGAGDLAVRLYAAYASKAFKVPIVVENISAASGITGILQGIHAAPNGYTLWMDSQASSAAKVAVDKTLPFSMKDRTYINELAEQPNIFAVSTKTPWKTLRQALAAAKADPGAFTWGAAQAGSSLELAEIELLNAAGVDIPKTRMVISANGEAEEAQALASGELDFGIINASDGGPLAAAGKVRLLAVTGTQRSNLLPNLPTAAQLGYKGVVTLTYQALAGPANLPSYVIAAWRRVIIAASKDPAEIKKAASEGFTLATSRDGPQMVAWINQQIAELVPLTTRLGLRH